MEFVLRFFLIALLSVALANVNLVNADSENSGDADSSLISSDSLDNSNNWRFFGGRWPPINRPPPTRPTTVSPCIINCPPTGDPVCVSYSYPRSCFQTLNNICTYNLYACLNGVQSVNLINNAACTGTANICP